VRSHAAPQIELLARPLTQIAESLGERFSLVLDTRFQQLA
jgi:hypothetical protein